MYLLSLRCPKFVGNSKIRWELRSAWKAVISEHAWLLCSMTSCRIEIHIIRRILSLIPQQNVWLKWTTSRSFLSDTPIFCFVFLWCDNTIFYDVLTRHVWKYLLYMRNWWLVNAVFSTSGWRAVKNVVLCIYCCVIKII